MARNINHPTITVLYKKKTKRIAIYKSFAACSNAYFDQGAKPQTVYAPVYKYYKQRPFTPIAKPYHLMNNWEMSLGASASDLLI